MNLESTQSNNDATNMTWAEKKESQEKNGEGVKWKQNNMICVAYGNGGQIRRVQEECYTIPRVPPFGDKKQARWKVVDFKNNEARW